MPKKKVRSRLSMMVEQALAATVRGPERYSSNILFELKEGQLTVVGTDGHRMVLCHQKVGGDYELTAVMANDTAKQVAKYVGPINIDSFQGRDWIHLDKRRLPLEPHTGVETFLDYTKPVAKLQGREETRVTVAAEELLEALKTVKIMADNLCCRLSATPGQHTIVFDSSDPDKGAASYKFLTGDVYGRKRAIGFNIAYVESFVQFHTETRVTFGFADTGEAIHLTVAGSADEMLLMPMRL